MERIAVLTSGGDAPGMNACIRAIVRSAISSDLEVMGVWRGLNGLLTGDMFPMDRHSVANILQRGGTILQTARSTEFYEPEGRARAAEQLRKARVDALIAIGGDGTFRGIHKLAQEQGIAVMGVPGTIDNDIYGTDYTIGFDTAVNTALDSIDKIRDTAHSLERLYFVEVMGRSAGFIALEVGLAGGAEQVLLPETPTDIANICDSLRQSMLTGKRSFIVVVAEGDERGGAVEIARQVHAEIGIDYRVTVLGHVQRGGAPSARDRVLASSLGVAAVEGLLQGEQDCMAGEAGWKIVYVPLPETWEKQKTLPEGDLHLVKLLS